MIQSLLIFSAAYVFGTGIGQIWFCFVTWTKVGFNQFKLPEK